MQQKKFFESKQAYWDLYFLDVAEATRLKDILNEWKHKNKWCREESILTPYSILSP
jgi:hypothetical protein